MHAKGPGTGDWLRLIPEPALVVRASGLIVASNDAFANLVGRSVDDSPLTECLSVAGEDLAGELRMWARNMQPLASAVVVDTPDGPKNLGVYAGRLSGPAADGDQPLVLVIVRSRDARSDRFQILTEKVQALTHEVSVRKQTELELLTLKNTLEERVETRTQQLRSLAARLIEAEELERRRLAHALHDNLQQLLVTAALQIDILDSLSSDLVIREIAQRLRTLVQESISASRSLTLDLSPPILHDGGLVAALSWLSRRNRELNNLEVRVSADQRAEPDDEQTKVALFTAARELLFNVVKHAGVSTADVTLESIDAERIRLTVRDEGIGMGNGAKAVAAEQDGFGLFSLRERIDFLGGDMQVSSSPGNGTTVNIEVPRGLRSIDAGLVIHDRSARA